MANIARVRVELQNKYNDPVRNFREMFQEFRKRVGHAGILHDLKEHEVFESRSQKTRRKSRESIKKKEQEILEQKILAGERVKAPSGVIKRILANLKKKNKRGRYVEE